MLLRRPGWIPFLLALLLPAAHAAGRCTMRTFTIPVTMDGMKPLISASINGAEARFVVDTGAFFQIMSPAAAARYKLELHSAPFGLRIGGIGGAFRPDIATVKSFTLGGASFRDVQFLVGGNDRLHGVAGSLGENLFRINDLELDLANGLLRVVEPSHCGDQELAYWARTAPIAAVGLHWTTEARPHLIAEAQLNGHSIRVVFDTGAARSVLSRQAARRAGISLQSPQVVRLGMISGIGREPLAAWSAPVDVFEIGGEKIEHTRVTVADVDLTGLHADMLLGADFFLAHHVYVANSQGKLYFTYNGGPVFDLGAPRPPQSPPAPGTAGEPDSSETPADAAAFLRRGAAYASRRQFSLAIADLTRACDLTPKDADCRYQRGLVYWHEGQPASALADLDAAVGLDPGNDQARLARAQVEIRQRRATVEDDLDAIDRTAPPEANLRLRLGQLYDALGEYAGAIHQFDLWIDYHREDVNLPTALTDRCGSEAAANIDVDRALIDCNRALRMMPKAAPIMASAVAMSDRGLVDVRQKKLDEALADFTAALKLRPGLPIALYGRGLVELRKGLEAQGRADLAAAAARGPGLARRLAGVGLAP